MHCPTLYNGKVKVGKADGDPDMLFSTNTTIDDCSTVLPPGQKYVAVSVLTGNTFHFVIDVNSKGIQLFNQVCNKLKLGKSELFGLAIYSDGIYQFVDPDVKLSKYAPKSWKSFHGNGIDNRGNILTFHFRVEIYVDCHLLINDKIARHHYYLQLKENVINYNQSLTEERAFLLAAYALQADFGNYNQEVHAGQYFKAHDYFPLSIISKIGEAFIVQHAPALHKDNTGLSSGEAEINYIKEASDLVSPHNLHFYKMNRKKSKLSLNTWLGISPLGIELYKEDPQKVKSHLSSFLWADISKLFFDKRKFEIRTYGIPEERKFTYYTNSEAAAKNMLHLCSLNHQYYFGTRTQVQTLRKLEQEGRKPYRESYIYSDETDLDKEQEQKETGITSTTLIPTTDISNKKYLNEGKAVVTTSSNSMPSVKLDVYESFMQNDSGHSSFAENRSNSASPDMPPQVWNEKLRKASRNSKDTNLLSVPYPSNQIVSSVLDKSLYKEFEKCQSTNESYSKHKKYDGVSNHVYNSKTTETSHSISTSTSWKSHDCIENSSLINKGTNLLQSISPVSHCTNRSTTTATPCYTLCGKTRIGVSSLSHQQNINPLQMTGDKIYYLDDIKSRRFQKCHYDVSSDSGVSSPTNGTLNGKSEQCSVCFSHLDTCSDNQFNCACKDSFSEDRFPCIPPPPGYENSSEDVKNQEDRKEYQEVQHVNSQHMLSAVIPKQRTESCHSCQTPSIIDLQQLRKKSQDMGLPLLSALCNDRSLLMLPKTVPTCSRNRHLGIDSNRRRFSCSAVNPSYIDELPDNLSVNAVGARDRAHTTPEMRPTSWHVDRDFPWQNPKFTELQQNGSPVNNVECLQSQTPFVTSSILTSFSTSTKDSPSHYTCTQQTSTPSRQMIPTKLLGNIRVSSK